MNIPSALLRIVRRKTYTEAKVCHRHGGKNFPPKKSAMFSIYKYISDSYKRKYCPDMYYISRAILHFSRSRSFSKLSQMASFERRFGDMNLGFSLQKAINTLGTGAKRQLFLFDEVLEQQNPTTWSSSK
jgi:hypothetical protein